MTLSFFEEFDFDDAAETEPQRPAKGRRGGRGEGGGDGPRRPSADVQWQRLLPVAGAVVLVLVIGWLLLGACGSSSGPYKDYVQKVNVVVDESNSIAKQLDNALNNPDQSQSGLISAVSSLEAKQRDAQRSAEQIKPPGKLRDAHTWLVAAMQYRTQGLGLFKEALARALAPKKVTETDAESVSQAYERLLASDVIYSDSFQAPAMQVLTKQGVKDAALADSVFALDPDFVTPSSILSVLQQIKTTGGATQPGGSCPGGNVAVGTALLKVEYILPSGGRKRLTPGAVTTVPGTDTPRFVVTVTNPGDIRVSRVQVRLVESGRAGATIPPHKETIDAIEPGHSDTVTLTGATPQFAGPETIKVEVVPVPCETKKDNNSAIYKVQYQVQ
jgi:hypothetical protein